MLDPFRGAGDLVSGAATAIAGALAGPLARYLLATHGLADPRLAALWRLGLACLAAALAVPLALWGLTAISGARPVAAGARLAALATAVVALPATRAEAALANAVSAAVLPHPARGLWPQLVAPAGPRRELAAALAAGVCAALLVVVAVLALARWATVWLLVALAPVAMGFALVPGGARLVGTWWRLQVSALFLPVAHAVALATYLAMFARRNDPIVASLAGIAVLVLIAKLPAWAGGLALAVETRDFSARARGAVLTHRALPARRTPPERP